MGTLVVCAVVSDVRRRLFRRISDAEFRLRAREAMGGLPVRMAQDRACGLSFAGQTGAAVACAAEEARGHVVADQRDICGMTGVVA